MNVQRLACALIMGVVLSPFASRLGAQTGAREGFPGVNNFWRIDATASNGGAINSPDLAIPELKRRGFKAIIDVAGGATAEAEGSALQAAGMKYFLIPINAKALDPALAESFLKAARDWMIKRVLVDGWSVERAGAEATTIGLINNNEFVPGYWQFAREFITAHGK